MCWAGRIEFVSRLTEAQRRLDLLFFVGEKPLRMRPELIKLRLQVDRYVCVQLERGHRTAEWKGSAVAGNPGE